MQEPTPCMNSFFNFIYLLVPYASTGGCLCRKNTFLEKLRPFSTR